MKLAVGEGVMDETLARMLAYRNNIKRYSRLLNTELTEIEREYIRNRLSEEQSALEGLGSPKSPIFDPNQTATR